MLFRAVAVTLLVAACGDDGSPVVPGGLDGPLDEIDAAARCAPPRWPEVVDAGTREAKNWDIH